MVLDRPFLRFSGGMRLFSSRRAFSSSLWVSNRAGWSPLDAWDIGWSCSELPLKRLYETELLGGGGTVSIWAEERHLMGELATISNTIELLQYRISHSDFKIK